MIRRASPIHGRACALALAASVAIVPGLAFPQDEPAPTPPPASPLPARAGAPSPPRSSPVLGAQPGNFDLSGILALDIPTADYDVGPRLTAELMYGAVDFTPELRLLAGARAAFAYHGRTGGSLWLLEAVPDVKLRAALTDQFGVYGDLGLGFSFQHRSADIPGGSVTDDSVPFTIQFGLGATLALTPDLSLISEFRVNTYTKSGSPVFITVPTLGLMFRM